MKRTLIVMIAVTVTAFVLQSCAPTNPHLTEAKISMGRNDYQKAKEELAKVLEQQPDNIEAAYLEGYIHFSEDNWQKMHESFQRVRSMDPEYEKESIDNMSLRAFGNLRSSGINEKFNRGVQLLSTDPEAADRFFISALKDLEMADMIKSDDFITKDIIAMIYLQMGETDKALEKFRDAIDHADMENDRDNLVSVYINMSNIHLESENFEKSLEKLNKVLEFDPENKEALLQIAKYYESIKAYEKALPMYERMLELEPENIDVLFNQGISFKGDGQDEKAIANFEKILELNPDDNEAVYFLTMFYAEAENYEGIVSLIEPRYDSFDDDMKEKVSYYMQVSLVRLDRAREASKYEL